MNQYPPPPQPPDYGQPGANPAPGYGQAPPPRKKGSAMPWILLGCGALLAILLVVGVGGFLAFKHYKDKAAQAQNDPFSYGSETPAGDVDAPAPVDAYFEGLYPKMDTDDRAYIITANDLWPFFSSYSEIPGNATLDRTAYSDGTLIQYNYSDSSITPSLTVFCQAGHSYSAGPDMLNSLVDGISQGLLQGGGGQVTMEDAPGLMTWGEYTRSGYFVMDGNRVGFFVAGVKGPRIFVAMTFGVHLEDPESVRMWIGPALMNLENWTP